MNPEVLVNALTKKERMALLKALIDFYSCVTVKGKEYGEDSISSEDIRFDKTANECIIIRI